MSPTLSAGLLQWHLAWEDPVANMHRVAQILSVRSLPDLILLPEMWSTGFTMHADAAEPSHGPACEWMRTTAATHQVHIAGSIATLDGAKRVNRFCHAGPDGQLDFYDKHHLFRYGHEDDHYHAGQQQLTFSLNGWRIRAIICYDLRFPAWCRNTDDYDVLLVVANWPEARIHHWDALLKARAIENQAYVLAVNRTGKDGNQLMYPGHSTAIDMNGEVLHFMGHDTEGMDVVTLDKHALEQFRQQYRFLQDRDRFHFS